MSTIVVTYHLWKVSLLFFKQPHLNEKIFNIVNFKKTKNKILTSKLLFLNDSFIHAFGENFIFLVAVHIGYVDFLLYYI
jgi:hypothetical protein